MESQLLSARWLVTLHKRSSINGKDTEFLKDELSTMKAVKRVGSKVKRSSPEGCRAFSGKLSTDEQNH